MKNKICCICKIEKEIGEFSLKSRKGEPVLRYDPKCKACKKADRKDGVQADKKHISVDDITTRSNLSSVTRSKRIVADKDIEVVLGIDELGLNKTYADNFNELIQILRTEYATLIGITNVYIKKTK